MDERLRAMWEQLRAGLPHGHEMDVPRIEPICGLVYPGPDPLGVGLGLCTVLSSVWHREHRDRHGRAWTTDEDTRLGLPASFRRKR